MKTLRRHRQLLNSLLALLVVFWQICQPLQAATYVWNQQAGGTYSWQDTINWLPVGVPNGVGEVVNLNNDILGAQTINLDGVLRLGTLNLGDSSGSDAFTLAAGTGGYLLLDAGSGFAQINKLTGGADIISTSLQFNDNLSVNNSSAGLLTLSGALRSLNSTLTIGGSGNTTLSAAYSSLGGLVKEGAGLLDLTGASTYAGTTTVNAGTLRVSNATGLPIRTAVNVMGGATLDVNQAFTLGSLSGAGDVVNPSATSRIITVGRDDASSLFSGRINPATAARIALTKIGAGTLTLQPSATNASTYTGNTTVNGGAIELNTSSSSLSSGFLAATPLVLAGGNFGMTGRGAASVSQTLGALTVNAGGGAITLTPNGGTLTALTTAAVTATASGGVLLINAPATTEFRMGTAIAATALNGRLVFSDGTANTFNWAWNNNATATAVSGYTGYTALPATTGATNVAYRLTAGQTQTGNTAAGTLKLSSSGIGAQILNLAGFNLTLGGTTTATPGAILIDGTDAWSINGTTGVLGQATTAGGDLIFQQFNTTNPVTVNAGIANGAGTLNLVKSGPGTLVLAGANTFTGTVVVAGGVLSFSNVTAAGAGSLGNGSTTAVTIRDGATLRYTGATGTISGAASTAGAHTYTLPGGNATIDVTAAGTTLTLAGAISGAGGYTKTGPGTLEVGASSTFTGPLFINQGMLRAGPGFQVSSSSSPVTVGASGTLDINGSAASQTLTIGSLAGSGTLTNAGASAKTLSVGGDNTSTSFSGLFAAGTSAGNVLTKVGSGVFTLANTTTSAWTGGNNVNGGVLRIATSNALSSTGTTNIALAAGPSQLELSAGVAQTLAAVTFYGTGTTTTSQGNILIGAGATLTLGGTLTVNSNGNPLGAVIAGPGSLSVGGAARTFTVNNSTSVPAAEPELTLSANLTSVGAFGFTKNGNGTMLISGTNSSSGTNTFQNGLTILDYGANNTSKLGTGGLAMSGGTLLLLGNAAANTSETVASTTLAGGGLGTINLNPGAAQQIVMNLGAFTRAAGAGTLRLNLPAGTQSATHGFTTTSANGPEGFIGGWLTVYDGIQTGFAVNSGGNLVAFTSTPKDDISTWLAGDNITDSTGFTGSLATDLSIGSLRFNAAGPSTVTLGSSALLAVSSGGILQTSSVTNGASILTGGRLTAGPNAELIFTTDSSSRILEVASTITASNGITKSGPGTLRISGQNDSVGTVALQAGLLELTGGNAIGDNAPVVLTNTLVNPTLSLLDGQTETIGNLSGGGTTGGTVVVGTGAALTLNQTGTTTYSGAFTGTGNLVKAGAGTLTLDNASPGFSGSLDVNGGRLTLSGTFGAFVAVNAVTLNGAELQNAQNQTGNVNRIGDTASVILNNTAGTSGFLLTTNQNATRGDTIGVLSLNAGQNVVTLDATGGTSSIGRLTVGSNPGLSRGNNATALVRGRNLGLATGQRTELLFNTAPTAIGGVGAAGTTTISVIPYLLGQTIANATPGAADLGNTFVTHGANGLRPLVTTSGAGAEYVFDQAGYNAMADSTTNNVRFTTTPAGTLAAASAGTRTINTLAIDSSTAGVAITGPASDTLALTAGALLSTGANANTLGGFAAIVTGTSEYIVFTPGTNQLTLASSLTTAGAALTKAGAGSLILSGPANAYAGGTWFNEGIVEAGALGNLGVGNLNFFGGALRWASGATYDVSSRTVLFGLGGGTFDTNGNNILVSGAIGGGGSGSFTKAGLGTLTLNAAANWTGGTTVSGGTLRLGLVNAITPVVSLSGGGTLDIAGLSPTFSSLTLGAGTNLITNSLPGTGALTVNGPTTLTEGSIAPVLTATSQLVKTGTGTARLDNALNTYTGRTWVQNGILEIASLANAGVASSLGAPAGVNAELFLGAGTTSGVLLYTGSVPASTNRPFVLAGSTGGGGIDSGSSPTGLLTINSPAYAFNQGTKNLILQGSNGTAAAPNVYAGTIQNGYGVVGLTKTGTGTWTLTANNAIGGNITVTGGTLNIQGTLTGTPASSLLSYGSAAARTIVNVSNDMTLFGTQGGNNAAAIAVYNQTAGLVSVTGNTSSAVYVAGAAGSYGFFNLTGGTYQNPRRFALAVTTNLATPATAVAYIGGNGFLDLRNSEWMLSYSHGQLTVAENGMVDRSGASAPYGIIMDSTTVGGQYGVLNVAGGSFLTTTQPLRFGNNTGAGRGNNNTALINLAAGTLQVGVPMVSGLPVDGGNNAFINFAGGTLRTSADITSWIPASSGAITYTSTLFGAINNGAVAGAPSFTGGLVVDTNGFNSTLTNNLNGASGFGVTQGNLVIPEAGNTGYIGAPSVIFSNPAGGGTPASGYALINEGKVAGIVITSPGTYANGETPTVTLTGGGGTIAPFTVSALTTANSSGGLTKFGDGILALTGTNTFSGPTFVNGGVLSVLPAAISSTSQLHVGATGHAAFDLYQDGLGAALVMPSGADVILGSALYRGGLGFQLGTVSDTLTLSGGGELIVNSGGGVINAMPIAGFAAGSYALVTGANPIVGGNLLTLGNLPGGFTYSLDSTTDPNRLTLIASAATAGDLYWRGDVNASWSNYNGGNTNWTSDAAGLVESGYTPGAGDTVWFSAANAGAVPINTTLDNAVSIKGLRVRNSGTGTVSIAPGVAGSLAVGADGITLQTGVPSLLISAPLTLAAAQTWTVADAGSVLTLSGIVSGGLADSNQTTPAANTSLIIRGSGAVDLTNGGNTFTGDILVDGGTLRVDNNRDWGVATVVSTTSKTITLTNGGTLAVTAGTLNPGATTTTTYNLLQIGSGGGIVDIAAGAALQLDDAGQLFGSGTLTKTGLGTLSLRNQGTSYGGFSGNLIVAAGTVQHVGGSGFNFGTTAGSTIIQSGARLNVNGFSSTELEPFLVSGNGLLDVPTGVITNSSGTAGGIAGPVTLLSPATIGAAAAGGLTLSGGISGAYDLTIRNLAAGGTTLSTNAINLAGSILNASTGTGGVTLSAVIGASVRSVIQNSSTSSMTLGGVANLWNGGLVVRAGTVIGGNNAATFGSANNVITLGDTTGSASVSLQAVNTFTYPQPINVVGGNTGIASIIAGTTTGSVIFSGPITLDSHDVVLGKSGTTGASQFTGGITGIGNITINNTATTGTLALAGGLINTVGSITHLGSATGVTTISADIGGNVLNLVQNSANTPLTLSGTTIAYTGTTTVSAGTLNVTGSTAAPFTSNAITVAGGATLNLVNGTGQTFNLAGLNLGAGTGIATLGLDLGNTSNYDSLSITGAASVANSIRFNLAALTGFGTGSYNLLSAASGLNAATYLLGIAPGGYTYTFNNSAGLVQLQVGAGAAGDIYWRGDVDASWSNYNGGNTNWVNAGGAEFGSTPGPGNTVIFSSAAAPGPVVSTTLDNDVRIDSLQFTTAPTGVTAVNIASGLLPTAALTIAPALSSNGISVGANAGTITISSPVVVAADQTWNVNGTGTSALVVNGSISGSSNFIKTGAGLLSFTSGHTFTGNLSIAAGTLRVSGGTDRLGAGSVILSGGTLDISDSTGRNLGRPTFVTANSQIITQRAAAGAGVTHTLGTLSIGAQTLTVSGGNVTSGTARLDFGATTFTGTPTFNLSNPVGATTQLTLGALDNGGFNATVTGTGNLAQGGIWSGSGGLILDSTYTGTVTLSQANTFNGGIVVRSGTLSGSSVAVTNVFGDATLVLGDSAANSNPVLLTTGISNASIANPIVLASGSTGGITIRSINSGSGTTYTGGVTGTNSLRLDTTAAGALTFAGADFDITGAITNVSTGTGTVTLASNLTSKVTNVVQSSATSVLNLTGTTIAYTGTTTVSAGTLNVTGSTAAPFTSNAITVAGGATLNLVNGTGQTFNLAGLNLGAGTGIATLGLELGNTTNYDSLSITGAASVANSIRFNLAALTGFGTGSYNLLSAASGLNAATYLLGIAPGGYTYTFNNSAGLVQLQVGAGATGSMFWRGDVDASWSNYNGGNTNWFNGGGTEFGSTPGKDNVVVFSSASAVGPTISTTLDTHVTIDSLQFVNAPTGVTAVNIASGLLPTAALTIAPALSSNGISVGANAGTATISAPVVVAADQTWNVDGTGTSALVVSGALSGSAALAKTGAGALTLSADNAYSGTLTVSAGTLNIGSGGATGLLGSGSIVNNGSLVFNRTGTFTISNLITGSGSLTKSAAGIMTLDNNSNTFAGPITISAGTLAFTTIGDFAPSAAATSMGSPTTLAQGAISLAGTLSFTGSTSQSTNRPINTTASSTLSANGTDSAGITYNGAISQVTNNSLTLTGTGSGAIRGGVTQLGTTADLNVNSGSWTLSGAASVLADDIVVTNANSVLNLDGASLISFTTGTSNGLHSRAGAVVNILSNNVFGPDNSGGLDFINVGDTTTGAAGVLNVNTFNLTSPGLLVGATGDGLEGNVTGSGTITVTSTATDWSLGIRTYRGSIAANLAGVASFLKQGLGQVILSGNNSGLSSTVAATRLDAGTLILDFGSDNNNKISASVALDMRGASLLLRGGVLADSVQNVNGFSLATAGSNVIDVSSDGAFNTTLSLGAISRANGGGTVLFLPGVRGSITTSSTNNATTGLLGSTGTAFATIRDGTGTYFAINNGSGTIAPLTYAGSQNDVTAWLPGSHVTNSGTGFSGVRTSLSINSLRFDAPAASLIEIAPLNILTLASGGILQTSNVTGGETVIRGGRLAAAELVLNLDSADSAFRLSSYVSGTTLLTKAGAGTLILDGLNHASGTTSLQNGTIRLVGGNAIGDRSAVVLSDDRASTLEVVDSETIGNLSGGNINTGMTTLAQVLIGGSTLTINQTAATTYSGLLSGTGNLVKTGTSTLNLSGASAGFTGNLIVNQGQVTLGDRRFANLSALGSLTLNAGSLLLDFAGGTEVANKIRDAAAVTMINTGGIDGLRGNNDRNDASKAETVGALTLLGGANTLTASASAATGTTQRAMTLTVASLTRSNRATLLVRGQNLGTLSTVASTPGSPTMIPEGSAIHTGRIVSTAAPTLFGGAGAAQTTTVSIVPWAVGGNGITNAGDSFVTHAATTGFRPLIFASEYEQLAAAGGVTLNNNVRYSGAVNLTLDSATARTMNALLVDNTSTTAGISLLGANATLNVNSGAFLFTGSATPQAITLGGFSGITTGAAANEYILHVTNTATAGVTIASPFTTVPAALTKSGAGTLILTATGSTYSGPTTINQGILQIDSLNKLGNLGLGGVFFNGGTLRFAAAFDLSAVPVVFGVPPVANVDVTAGGVLNTNGFDLVFNNSIGGGGNGGFTKTGAGVLTLNAAADYRGATTIGAGSLFYGTANALPVGTDLTLAASTTLQTGANAATLRGLTLTGSATLSAAAALQFTGNLLNSGGNNTLTVNNSAGTAFNGDFLFLSESATARTFTVNHTGSGLLSFNSSIVDGGAAASNFVKTGSGTLEINRSAFHNGSTTVDNGIFRINAEQHLIGALQFGSASTVTTAGIVQVNENVQFGSLVVQTNSTVNTNSLVVATGKTFRSTGNVTIGTNAAAGATTLFSATGGGSFLQNAPGGTFQIGGATGATNTSSTTADFSGLTNFTVNLGAAGTFRVGDNNTNTSGSPASNSTLILASTDASITAGTLNIGQGTSQGAAIQTLSLGAGTNTLNVDTLNIGGNTTRSGGRLQFAGATGSLVLRGVDGVSPVTVNMVNGNVNTGIANSTSLLLAGHQADVLIGTMTMAAKNVGTGTTTATLTFDQGSLDISSLVMTSSTGSFAAVATSNVTLGGGTSVIDLLTMAVNTSSAAATSNANFTVSGGTVTLGSGSGTAINMANAAASRTVTSNVNLTGGSVILAGNVIRQGGAGTETATFTLGGADLDMGGFNIGTAANPILFEALAGSLKNLAEYNGGESLIKSTTGTLRLLNGNTYTGETFVTAGTLLAANTLGSATGSGPVFVEAGATLGGNGRIAPALDSGITVLGRLQVGAAGDTSAQKLTLTTTGTGLTTVNGVVAFDLFGGQSSGTLNAQSGNNDQLVVNGASGFSIGAGATLQVSTSLPIDATWVAGTQWKLFDWSGLSGGVTGSFSNLSSPAPFNYVNLPDLSSLGLAWDVSNLYTSGTILVVVPEPGRMLLVFLGLMGLFFRRRR